MGAGQVGVQVDHLRLDPQPELHAEPAHGVDQRVQAVRPDVLVDVPVAQPGGVVAAVAEPAVVEDVPLDADLAATPASSVSRPRSWSKYTASQVLHHHRPRAARVVRPRAQMGVEARGHAVEADAVSGVHPRAGVALPRRERDLARQQQLAAAEHGDAGRQPLGVGDVVAAPRHVHRPHLARGACRSRRCRPRGSAARPGPVRPRRFSRECTPTTKGSRCGDALAAPAPGEVEQLGGHRRHGQGEDEPVDRVGLPCACRPRW